MGTALSSRGIVGDSLIAGALYGADKQNDPQFDSLAYTFGWMGGYLATGILTGGIGPAILTARDTKAYIEQGDYFGAFLTVLPTKFIGKFVKGALAPMVAKAGNKIDELAKVLVTKAPDEAIQLLDEVYNGAASTLKNVYNFTDDIIIKYGKNKINLQEDVIKGADNIIEEYGKQGFEPSKKVVGKLLTFDESITSLKAGEKIEGTKVADVVVTTINNTTIKRELKLIKQGTDVSTLGKLEYKLKDLVGEAIPQLKNANQRELYIQIDAISNFTNREYMSTALSNAIEGTFTNPPNKVIVYNKLGEIMGVWSG